MMPACFRGGKTSLRDNNEGKDNGTGNTLLKDDFATIYGDEVEPVDYEGPEGEALEPAA